MQGITKEDARKKFMDYLHGLVDYWATDANFSRGPKTPKEKLSGLAFSILATIDGDSIELPHMDIVLKPHPSDEQFHRKRNEDWFVDGMAINDDVAMHEHWHEGKKDDDVV